jgi:putative spermidine/putrescine transport system substrate-binding protein
MGNPESPLDRSAVARFFRSEAFRASGLTRRQFVARGGGLALALGATEPFLRTHQAVAQEATPTPAAAAGPVELPEITDVPEALKGSGEVRVTSSGGAFAEAERVAYWEPFEQVCGIKVVPVEGFGTTQVKAQIDSGNVEWDVVSFDRSNVLNLLAQGDYFEPIDYTHVDTEHTPEVYRHDYSLGHVAIGTVINYRTDAFATAPQSYADFWNLEAFPGPRNWMAGTMGISPFLEGALLADGVPMDQLYPLDIERALASLSRIRDDIVKFWESGAQSAQLMADGETVLGVAWNGRIATLEDEGVPVAIQWNQAMLGVNNRAVLKGAPNRENAMKFLAFGSMAVPQARLSLLIPYGYTNTAAAEYIPEARLSRLPTAPQYAHGVFLSNAEWWAENLQAATDAWNEWLIS